MGGRRCPEAHSRKLRAHFAESRRQRGNHQGRASSWVCGTVANAVHYPETYASCTSKEPMNQALGRNEHVIRSKERFRSLPHSQRGKLARLQVKLSWRRDPWKVCGLAPPDAMTGVLTVRSWIFVYSRLERHGKPPDDLLFALPPHTIVLAFLDTMWLLEVGPFSFFLTFFFYEKNGKRPG